MRVTKTTTINNSPKNQTQMERVMEKLPREKERISDAGSIESERMEFLFSSHGD